MLTNPSSHYNIRTMSRVCDSDPQNLRHWIREGLLTPLRRDRTRRGAPMLFSFTELLKAKVITQMREQNIPLQRVRQALLALERFNLIDSQIFLVVDGDDIWAETDEKQILSLVRNCGQLLLVNIAHQRAKVEECLKVLWPGEPEA